MSEIDGPTGAERRKAYERLTARIGPFASEGDSTPFDRIVKGPVDAETVGLVAECLADGEGMVCAYPAWDPLWHRAARQGVRDRV